MVYFVVFYLLLVLSTHLMAIFNANTIAPLIIAYGAILYYFFKYMKGDNIFRFSSEILGALLIVLAAFEFDNIIAHLENLQHLLPVSVHILIYLCLIVLLVCIAALFTTIPFFTQNNLYIACVAVLTMDVLFILFTPRPGIDVYVHLKEAVEYFLAFKNPYANLYTQIYTPEQIKVFYYDDPVFLKYVPFQSVPPVSILVSAVGALLGDIRIVNAILFCISPLFLRRICLHILPSFSDTIHKKMALVVLLLPAQLHLIFLGWTDMQMGFFLILFIYFFLKKQKVASYVALGVFLALKQYSVIYFIPFLFIVDLKDWRFWVITGGIILLPLVVYAVWDFNGFVDGIILYELKQPFREDSISIAKILVRYFGLKVYSGPVNAIILLSSTVIAIYCCFKKITKLENEYQKIKLLSYVVLFQFSNFIMFSKQSFLNQYYLLILMYYLALLFSIQTKETKNRSYN